MIRQFLHRLEGESKKEYYRRMAQFRKEKYGTEPNSVKQEAPHQVFEFQEERLDADIKTKKIAKGEQKCQQKIRNRMAAQQSRERHRLYVQELERKVRLYQQLIDKQGLVCKNCRKDLHSDFTESQEVTGKEVKVKEEVMIKQEMVEEYLNEQIIRIDNNGAMTPFGIFFVVCVVTVLAVFAGPSQAETRMLTNQGFLAAAIERCQHIKPNEVHRIPQIQIRPFLLTEVVQGIIIATERSQHHQSKWNNLRLDQIRRIRLLLSRNPHKQHKRNQKALIPPAPYLKEQNLLIKRLPEFLKLQTAIKRLAEGINLPMLPLLTMTWTNLDKSDCINKLIMIYNYHLLFKYIIVGDPNVGKSSLLLRFIDNKFTQNYESTLGVQFGSKILTVGTTVVKTMIWDTAGQESFKSIIRSYYKNSIVALLVFDITSYQSFENLQRWLEEVKTNANEHIRIVVIGNKSDQYEKRTVKKELAQEFANSIHAAYFETSAKSGSNVNEIFIEPSKQLISDIQSKRLIVNSNTQSIGIKIGNPEMRSTEKASIQISIQQRQKENCKC